MWIVLPGGTVSTWVQPTLLFLSDLAVQHVGVCTVPVHAGIAVVDVGWLSE